MKYNVDVYFKDGSSYPEFIYDADSADMMDMGTGILRVEKNGVYFFYPLNTISKYVVRERRDDD